MGFLGKRRGGKCRLSLNPKKKKRNVRLSPHVPETPVELYRLQDPPHTPRSQEAAAALLQLSALRTPRGTDAAATLCQLSAPTDNDVIFSPRGQQWSVSPHYSHTPNRRPFSETKRALHFGESIKESSDQRLDNDYLQDFVPLQDEEINSDTVIVDAASSVAVQTESVVKQSVGIQTDQLLGVQKMKASDNVKLLQQVKPRKEVLTYAFVVGQTQQEFRRLTGLYQPQFLMLLDFLGRDVGDVLKYRSDRGTPKKKKTDDPAIPCELRLLITLLRLRRGWDVEDLALFFGVSVYTISTTVSAWVQFMYRQFKRMQRAMFVSRHAQTKQERPPAFKSFDNFRVCLDTTEVKIQSPENLDQQGNTYSDYKAGNVWLYLIGISCWGGISFVSPGFEGSMSDEEIYRRSGIRDFLEPGDVILADRGFKVEEECDEDGVTLLHPPFLRGRSHFTPEEETLTREVAKARIFVEHLVRKIKIFKVLKKITNNMLHYLDEIVYVVGCIINFLPCVVHPPHPKKEAKKTIESSESEDY